MLSYARQAVQRLHQPDPEVEEPGCLNSLRGQGSSRFLWGLTMWLGIGVALFFYTIYFHTGSASDHRNLYYALIFLPFVAFIFWRRALWQVLWASWIFRLTLLLAALAVISILYTPESGLSDFYDAFRYSVLIVTFVALLVWLRAQLPGFPKAFLQGLSIFAAAAAIYWSTGYFLDQGGLTIGSRMAPGLGYTDNPIPFGELFAAGSLVSLVLAMRARSGPAIALWLFLAAACLLPTLLSQSRGPLVGFALAVLALIAYDRRWLILAGTTALLAIGGTALLVADSQYRDLTDTRNIEIRLNLYQDTWSQIQERPILGHGWRTDDSMKSEGRSHAHPHNDLLLTWYRGGLLALVPFLLLVGVGLYAAWRAPRQSTAALASVALLVFYLGITLVTKRWFHTNPSPAWLYFWLPLAWLIPWEIELRAGRRGRAATQVRSDTNYTCMPEAQRPS